MKRSQLVIRTYFALIGSAHAADLTARYTTPIAPPPALLFQGAYMGVQIGAEGVADRWNTIYAPTNGALTRHTSRGGSVIGGAHAGYDWRSGPIVFGLRADVSGGHAVTADANIFGVGVVNTLDVQGSLRGRVGYAFNRLLVYGTGGLNVAHVQHDYRSAFTTVSEDHIVVGPTVGVGAEYAFDNHWRAHLEYRMSALSTRKEAPNPFNPLLQTRHDAGSGAATVGVSYRLGE